MSSGHWKAWVAALALFVSGIGVGGAVTAWVGLRDVREGVRGNGPGRGMGQRAVETIRRDLTRELELTAEESARVQVILDQSAARIRLLRLQAARQAAGELRASARQIAEELPPEKRAEFRRIMAKRFQRLGVDPADKE